LGWGLGYSVEGEDASWGGVWGWYWRQGGHRRMGRPRLVEAEWGRVRVVGRRVIPRAYGPLVSRGEKRVWDIREFWTSCYVSNADKTI
jgi:hypothetical protein